MAFIYMQQNFYIHNNYYRQSQFLCTLQVCQCYFCSYILVQILLNVNRNRIAYISTNTFSQLQHNFFIYDCRQPQFCYTIAVTQYQFDSLIPIEMLLNANRK